jgi:predicted ATPase
MPETTMLTSLAVKGFKSLREVEPLQLKPLTLFFGPNGAGKSNLIDAVLLLSQIQRSRKIAEAFDGPIRGLPLEQFSFPAGLGLPGLLQQEKGKLRFEAELALNDERVRYSIELGMATASGSLTVEKEVVVFLGTEGQILGMPYIIRGDITDLMQMVAAGLTDKSPKLSIDETLNDLRLREAKSDEVRAMLSSFRTYYLDPRIAMRSSLPPKDVDDIGPLGESLAPFLYRLKAEKPAAFAAVKRTLKALIPSIDDLVVEIDPRRGMLDVEIRQGGTPFSVRLVSEGTLRVLALICAVVNPWGGPVIAFEEPENGVHPRRIEMIARIFGSLLSRKDSPRQMILTSHSPQFCAAILALAREKPQDVALYRTLKDGDGTRFLPFATDGPLADPAEINHGLEDVTEDRILEEWMLRGFLDG